MTRSTPRRRASLQWPRQKQRGASEFIGHCVALPQKQWQSWWRNSHRRAASIAQAGLRGTRRDANHIQGDGGALGEDADRRRAADVIDDADLVIFPGDTQLSIVESEAELLELR